MADLTTLAAVKDWLGIADSDTGADSVLSRLISSESARFIQMTNNPIVKASYTDTRDGNGTRFYVPQQAWPRYPLVSVESVTIDGVTIPARESMDEEGWSIVDGRLELVGYVFTSTRVTSYFGIAGYPGFGGLSAGTGNVVIAYTAGYETVPADVDQAVVEMVGLKFKTRNRIGLMSQDVGGERLQFQTLTLPESIQSVIDNYSRSVL